MGAIKVKARAEAPVNVFSATGQSALDIVCEVLNSEFAVSTPADPVGPAAPVAPGVPFAPVNPARVHVAGVPVTDT